MRSGVFTALVVLSLSFGLHAQGAKPAPFATPKAARAGNLIVRTQEATFRSGLIEQVDAFASLMEIALAPCEHLPGGAVE